MTELSASDEEFVLGLAKRRSLVDKIAQGFRDAKFRPPQETHPPPAAQGYSAPREEYQFTPDQEVIRYLRDYDEFWEAEFRRFTVDGRPQYEVRSLRSGSTFGEFIGTWTLIEGASETRLVEGILTWVPYLTSQYNVDPVRRAAYLLYLRDLQVTSTPGHRGSLHERSLVECVNREEVKRTDTTLGSLLRDEDEHGSRR